MRTVCGALVLVVGLPVLLAGGALWLAMQHQDGGGGYTASLAEVRTDGYAVVAADVDTLLRQQAPFARAGRTSLQLTATTAAGAAFVGLAPASDVAEYLNGVPYAQVNEVRLARGELPVATEPVEGEQVPTPPDDQPFWIATNDTPSGALEWAPSELRGQQLALVVMDLRAEAPLAVQLTARLRPEWLGPTAWGLLALGTMLLLVAVTALAWPVRGREVVYVVPPTQVPEITARLGLPYERPADPPFATSTFDPGGFGAGFAKPGDMTAGAALAPNGAFDGGDVAAAPGQRPPGGRPLADSSAAAGSWVMGGTAFGGEQSSLAPAQRPETGEATNGSAGGEDDDTTSGDGAMPVDDAPEVDAAPDAADTLADAAASDEKPVGRGAAGEDLPEAEVARTPVGPALGASIPRASLSWPPPAAARETASPTHAQAGDGE